MSFFSTTEKPFLIAGPCSAETREQVISTAEAMQGLPIQLFRAGVWKPRTRPGSFEGKGVEALIWLEEIKAAYGFKTTIEVAEPSHVEAALLHHIDVLWIGARTVVNPFQVQRIADSLKGVKIPVMVKNPVNPDVDLWQGAIERFQNIGITELAAIHRGFSTYKTSNSYRNQPNWIIPVELKRRLPNIPIFCDPSHISGQASRVAQVAQKAMNIGFDGLMIETHINPNEAWSDAAQQITPNELRQLLLNLTIRNEYPISENGLLELEYLRQTVDNIDAEIIDLIGKRMEISSQMGEIKRQNNITAYQPERWREILETRCEQARKLSLSSNYIASIYELIHNESIKKQLEIPQVDNKNLEM
jgi:chorismate mutase